MAGNKGGPNGKIRTGGYEAIVRGYAAKGLTSRQISERLLEEHGFEISHVKVVAFLNEETEERRDAARSVAASEAKKSVPLVTGVLRKWVTQIDQLITEAIENHDERVADNVSKLVNAGTKAAKALHDITVGESPADSMSSLREEAMKILESKRKREAKS